MKGKGRILLHQDTPFDLIIMSRKQESRTAVALRVQNEKAAPKRGLCAGSAWCG